MSELMTELEKTRVVGQMDGTEHTQYLTFSVQDECFAVGIMDVREIIEIESLARVPMTPDYISGVINLRGNVVPVVDLGVRLGKDKAVLSDRTCIVMVELTINDQQQVLGMLVDTVNEILEIREEEIQPPPNFGTDISTDFIKHMGWVGDSFIILLDVGHVLALEDLAALDKVREMHETHQLEQERSLAAEEQRQENEEERTVDSETPSAADSEE